MAKPKTKISNLQPPISDHRSYLLFVIATIILAFLLRLAPLGRYVTPDEPAWVYRSICFADAIVAGDWAAVPSTGHPGVTTMWLGTLSVSMQRLLWPTESATHIDWIGRMAWLDPENGEAFRRLAFSLPGGRIAVALTTTLGLAALYPLLTRLFGRQLALLAVGLLAFDPFLVGHSGLLHTDALLATFTLLALAGALNGLREPRRAIWWILSGLFTGLALLTKTPAIILLPFIGLILSSAPCPFSSFISCCSF
jgi:4-amino-4-deoxy-L-arabinose transferase-like glycosyltransferase